jgi:hypothetical protein
MTLPPCKVVHPDVQECSKVGDLHTGAGTKSSCAQFEVLCTG